MIEITNEFIKKNDRLVRVIVNQFKVANINPEDLMQEGRIGLIEAAKRFDSSGCILVPSRELEEKLVNTLLAPNHETIYLDVCNPRPDYEL